jgi:excisionase family DNA binding protein
MKSESEGAHGSGDGRAHEKRDWLTLRQAADELQVSQATLRRAYHRRELVAYLVGTCLRIKRADLQAWLDSQRWSPSLCQARTARPRPGRRKNTRANSSVSPRDTGATPAVQ